ncbi:MAG TPA: DUF6458 family protein [Pseudonocardia sp.]|nr:DUF6458 family protein [Pseudonocardia sp.]
MRIGSSIALIAVGLVLALAVNIDLAGVDLRLVGWILAAVGAVGLVLTLTLWRPASRATTVVREEPVVRDDPRY